MIFVTIGAQEPFDRLIKAMDEIAPMLRTEVVAQVSRTAYQTKHMKAHEFLTPKEFDSLFSQADLIVSHAGMGTIISALVKGKPILVVPRLARYGETRNDHQLATARMFEQLKYVQVAYDDEQELKSKLHTLLQVDLKHMHKIGRYASPELITSIKSSLQA